MFQRSLAEANDALGLCSHVFWIILVGGPARGRTRQELAVSRIASNRSFA
jgi:hypothetical protein